VVIPRSARTAVGGRRDGALVVRVGAPPVEGAANEAAIEAVARALGVPRGAVAIERGERGRHKVLSAPATVRAVLETL
jgi:uncharacterized protein YggU (UPF0235/DUF167 family)